VNTLNIRKRKLNRKLSERGEKEAKVIEMPVVMPKVSMAGV
jgi:hypothetical protein